MSNEHETKSKGVVKVPQKFGTELVLKDVIHRNYMRQITNYFGDEKQAMKFLSGVVAATQRLPELLNCTAPSVINSFMTMAQLGFMPSDVSGEAYVLPYKNKGVLEAQFQLGYQGLVTLFYRSGVRDINAEIVYKEDEFSYENGVIKHKPDVFADDRGEAIGAYVIITLGNGGRVHKVMSKKEIIGIGERFSKSYKADFTPWKEKNDPQLWMWKKTVLKQAAKLVPKNEVIVQAVAIDNRDSDVGNRLDAARSESEALEMGNLAIHASNQEKAGTEDQSEGPGTDAEGDQSTEDREESVS